jgi:hypothetical protein
MTDFNVGDPVRYFSEKSARQKLAFVSHTHDSVEDDAPIDRPEPGFAHLVVWNLSVQHFVQYANVPVRSMAESIPDYTVEGKLVGFFEVA